MITTSQNLFCFAKKRNCWIVLQTFIGGSPKTSVLTIIWRTRTMILRIPRLPWAYQKKKFKWIIKWLNLIKYYNWKFLNNSQNRHIKSEALMLNNKQMCLWLNLNKYERNYNWKLLNNYYRNRKFLCLRGKQFIFERFWNYSNIFE